MKKGKILIAGIVMLAAFVYIVFWFGGGDEVVVPRPEVGDDAVRGGGCDGGGYSAAELYVCLRNATVLVPGAGVKTGLLFVMVGVLLCMVLD